MIDSPRAKPNTIVAIKSASSSSGTKISTELVKIAIFHDKILRDPSYYFHFQ